MLLGNFSEIRTNAFLARARMAARAALLLEDSEPRQFFRIQLLPGGSGRGRARGWSFDVGGWQRGRRGSWRSLRSFSGRGLGVARRFLILGRGHHRGGGKAGPRDGGEKNKGNRKCSFPQADHRPAVDEGGQKEREHRHTREYHATHP